MRIVHFTSVHTPFDIRIFQKECRSLAAAGHEVSFVVPHVRDETAEGVRIKAIPKSHGRLSRMTKTAWKAFREAEKLKAEIYHFHDSELIPLALLLRLEGKKVVYDIHEDVPRDILSKDYLPQHLRQPIAWAVERIENFSCSLFSGLVAATPFIAERFERLNSRTIVIHNYPRLPELAPRAGVTWQQRSPAVAYVGGILPDRGIRELVSAMSLVPRELNATLKLAGEFFPATFKDELSQLKGWNEVEAVGLLDRSHVAELLEDVRAGIVTFLPELNHVCAMPHKLFEYMSAGIPIIASNFPLWKQIVQDIGCGLLVDPSDPKSLADAIAFVLTHPAEAEAMGRRGREAVESHYNWEREQVKLLHFYSHLLEGQCAA